MWIYLLIFFGILLIIDLIVKLYSKYFYKEEKKYDPSKFKDNFK